MSKHSKRTKGDDKIKRWIDVQRSTEKSPFCFSLFRCFHFDLPNAQTLQFFLLYFQSSFPPSGGSYTFNLKPSIFFLSLIEDCVKVTFLSLLLFLLCSLSPSRSLFKSRRHPFPPTVSRTSPPCKVSSITYLRRHLGFAYSPSVKHTALPGGVQYKSDGWGWRRRSKSSLG